MSLFVEPNLKDMQTSFELGADAVELHTGRFAQVTQKKKPSVSQIKKFNGLKKQQEPQLN